MEEETQASIEEFVKTALEQIKKGVGQDFYLNKSIEFELSVITTGKTDGNVDIKVLRFSKGAEQQSVQKIKFSVNHKDSLEFKQREAIKEALNENPTLALSRYLRQS